MNTESDPRKNSDKDELLDEVNLEKLIKAGRTPIILDLLEKSDDPELDTANPVHIVYIPPAGWTMKDTIEFIEHNTAIFRTPNGNIRGYSDPHELTIDEVTKLKLQITITSEALRMPNPYN